MVKYFTEEQVKKVLSFFAQMEIDAEKQIGLASTIDI